MTEYVLPCLGWLFLAAFFYGIYRLIGRCQKSGKRGCSEYNIPPSPPL